MHHQRFSYYAGTVFETFLSVTKDRLCVQEDDGRWHPTSQLVPGIGQASGCPPVLQAKEDLISLDEDPLIQGLIIYVDENRFPIEAAALCDYPTKVQVYMEGGS